METNTPINQEQLRGCSVWGVDIMSSGRVQFSNGNLGTKAQLYARVCKYTQNQNCINQDKVHLDEVTVEDGFPNQQNSQNAITVWKLFRT